MAQATKAQAKPADVKPGKGSNKGKQREASTGNSPIASLPARTDTAAATAPVSSGFKAPKNYTGQWLYGELMAGKEETRRLDMIKSMAAAVEAEALKKALDDMVAIARKEDEKFGFTKENKGKDGKPLDGKGPKYRSASNIRSIVMRIYGAIRFAAKELQVLGYRDGMGFHDVAAISRKALENVGLNWDGTKGDSKEDRETRRKRDAENKAIQSAMKKHPRNADESYTDYMVRVSELVEAEMQALSEENQRLALEKEAERLVSRFTPDMLEALADVIAAKMAEAQAKEDETA